MLLSLSLLSLVVALLVLLPAARGLLSPASPGTPAPKNPANAYAAATEAFVKSDPTYAFGLYNNLAPSPYLWQRGLAAYAVGSYAAAADQFRLDRSVNGGDGEELIWEFASRAKGEAEGRKLELAKSIFPAEGRSRDPRPVVASTVALFYAFFTTDPAQAEQAATTFAKRFERDDRELFYSAMYLGLLRDVQGGAGRDALWARAMGTKYARKSLDSFERGDVRSGDFMVATVGNLLLNKK